jgi:hypothetical protein
MKKAKAVFWKGVGSWKLEVRSGMTDDLWQMTDDG